MTIHAKREYEWLDVFPGPGGGWKPLRGGVIVSKRECGVPGMELAKVDLHHEGIHDLVEVYIRPRRAWTIEEDARVKFHSDGTFQVYVDDEFLADGRFGDSWRKWLRDSWPDVFTEAENGK